MQVLLDPSSIDSYRTFKQIKSLPAYSIRGRVATVPDEYASSIGHDACLPTADVYSPPQWMFDYQRDICRMIVRKRKFAVFADCGLGKTAMLIEFARVALRGPGNVLIVSPLNVIEQTLDEQRRFFPDMRITHVESSSVQQWLDKGRGVGITNYEGIKPGLTRGRLGAIALDESSMLKSHYGRWATELLRLGKGVDWKLCCTGTPAPNDRIEYANHAVFLDRFPTVNSFLATYFVNRGQTQNRWELKPHALRPFYRALSDWCIFLTNPAVYGWRDNCDTIPPINVHIHDVPMTDAQHAAVRAETGQLVVTNMGGITSRGVLGRIAKGTYQGSPIETRKPPFVRDLISSWPHESTLVWCIYNDEQDTLARIMPDAASIDGKTPYAERMRIIHGFQSGKIKTLISKPKILGFGLNLQVATRQVFSGLQDSYESYYQAVKRSNRYGSTRPLNVHIPVTDIERPMVDNVLRKSHRVQQDTDEQERLFREQCMGYAI